MGVDEDHGDDDCVSYEGEKIKHKEGPVEQDLQFTKRGEAQEDEFRRVAQICHGAGAGSLRGKATRDRDGETEMERQTERTNDHETRPGVEEERLVGGHGFTEGEIKTREKKGNMRIIEKQGIIEEKYGNLLIRREETQEQRRKDNTATDI